MRPVPEELREYTNGQERPWWGSSSSNFWHRRDSIKIEPNRVWDDKSLFFYQEGWCVPSKFSKRLLYSEVGLAHGKIEDVQSMVDVKQPLPFPGLRPLQVWTLPNSNNGWDLFTVVAVLSNNGNKRREDQDYRPRVVISSRTVSYNEGISGDYLSRNGVLLFDTMKPDSAPWYGPSE